MTTFAKKVGGRGSLRQKGYQQDALLRVTKVHLHCHSHRSSHAASARDRRRPRYHLIGREYCWGWGGFKGKARPSAYVIFPPARRPSCSPSFLGRTETLITSPGLSVSFDQPSCFKSRRTPNSTTQWLTLPCSSFTSKATEECGLANNKLVTVPIKVTACLSYTALPWCAYVEVAEHNPSNRTGKNAARVILMRLPLGEQ
jgi:hypothetical protein